QLLFANGESLSLHALVGATPGANTLVGFFYSSCHSICVTLGHDFHQLQNQIVEQGLEQKVKLLTISFDPENDTVPVLQAYQQRMDAKGDLWRIATVPDRESLSALLQTF